MILELGGQNVFSMGEYCIYREGVNNRGSAWNVMTHLRTVWIEGRELVLGFWNIATDGEM